MANQVPLLKKKFLSEPDYFKKVYKYVFELGKEDGAKVVGQYTQRVVPTVGRTLLTVSSLLPSPAQCATWVSLTLALLLRLIFS